LSAVRDQLPGQHVEARRLPRPVRPDQRPNLPPGQTQIHPVHGHAPAESLREADGLEHRWSAHVVDELGEIWGGTALTPPQPSRGGGGGWGRRGARPPQPRRGGGGVWGRSGARSPQPSRGGGGVWGRSGARSPQPRRGGGGVWGGSGARSPPAQRNEIEDARHPP